MVRTNCPGYGGVMLLGPICGHRRKKSYYRYRRGGNWQPRGTTAAFLAILADADTPLSRRELMRQAQSRGHQCCWWGAASAITQLRKHELIQVMGEQPARYALVPPDPS